MLRQRLRGAGAALSRLSRAFGYLLHNDSALALASLAFVLVALEQLARLPFAGTRSAFPIARAIWAAYFYLAFRKAADGSRRLPRLRDYRDSWDTLIHPLLQLALIGIWFWGPLLLYARATVGLDELVRRFSLAPLSLLRQADLTGYLLLGTWLIALPGMFVVSATRRELLVLLDPTCGLRMTWKLPQLFVPLLAQLQLLVVAGFAASTGAALLQQMLPIPLVGPLLATMVSLWIPLVEARLLGEFVDDHRDELAAIAGGGARTRRLATR